MVSRENTIIAAFVGVAFVLYLALTSLTDLSFAVVFGIVVVVGIVVPQVLIQTTDVAAEG